MFVKFDSYRSLYPQYNIQEPLSKLATGDASALGVPQACDFLTPDDRRPYLVMEYIKPTYVKIPDLPRRAAQALLWLRGLRPPPPPPMSKSAL